MGQTMREDEQDYLEQNHRENKQDYLEQDDCGKGLLRTMWGSARLLPPTVDAAVKAKDT